MFCVFYICSKFSYAKFLFETAREKNHRSYVGIVDLMCIFKYFIINILNRITLLRLCVNMSHIYIQYVLEYIVF